MNSHTCLSHTWNDINFQTKYSSPVRLYLNISNFIENSVVYSPFLWIWKSLGIPTFWSKFKPWTRFSDSAQWFTILWNIYAPSGKGVRGKPRTNVSRRTQLHVRSENPRSRLRVLIIPHPSKVCRLHGNQRFTCILPLIAHSSRRK